ncbi:MAG: sigma-70 family RNA polymerase sigma factor [Flavobacterium sp.]|jgi:RNA polymerase sigma-70 factor (ECF subfamily)|uniref:Sigma-70 family RNA polymerase sigma factor n=1 Tax=Flavobacterium macrobrachii TaxID=591204 RepID=A0ABS2CYA2_9FLAO|nr:MULTISPECIES: sigma-70 family RNA polymerase sigma factor [Flavobacterium]MBM6499943.1 sigma-70 family RNA polymerase sigma factor [Flavobacterium macrobrachii]MCZ8090199.1 sigma-70 family RNA polymerase sigma factor [Flavobacterium sp.]MCZ8332132.1 sigma-70 family RNA polymerase sigma factor [Flavobacterium sp.]PZO28558.1 MAG: RNA polymerase subunit sigma-24 [Flavobacteriaceae bacterium]
MAKSQVPDSVLVQMYISGNEDALATLINRYQSRIFGFIYSKVNDRDIADDYFQETFIRVINTLKSKKYYDEKGKFLSWVLRIANNLIVDDFRKNKNIKMLRDTEEFSIFSIIKDATPSVESNLISTQIGYDLRKIIEELPLDQQEVLKMRFFQEMTFKEISEATNVSMNTSLGRMRYAINNMRKIIEKNQIYLTA